MVYFLSSLSFVFIGSQQIKPIPLGKKSANKINFDCDCCALIFPVQWLILFFYFLRGRKACNINSVGFSVFWFNVNTRINFFYGLSLRQRANAWVNVHFLWTSGKCPKKEGKIIFLGQELENRKRYRNSSWKHSENCCFVRNSFFFLARNTEQTMKNLAITLIETQAAKANVQNVNLNFSQSSDLNCPFFFEGVCGVLLCARKEFGNINRTDSLRTYTYIVKNYIVYVFDFGLELFGVFIKV